MPPVVGILVAVLVLLVALAFIVPGRRPDPPPKRLHTSHSESPLIDISSQVKEPEPGAERLASAREIWGEFKRGQLRVKLLVGLGVSPLLSVASAYGAVRAALEHDWSGLIALGASCLFLIWASRLCWRGLRLH
jgi:hypothetical protein